MTDGPKKRPWLQFSLATAIVLMFVASGLLWLNMRGSYVHWTHIPPVHIYGWPEKFEEYNPSAVNPFALLYNVSVWLTILVATAVVCEWFVRHRERNP